jgi:eukaryotic-like serine/threonine-protein kinase
LTDFGLAKRLEGPGSAEMTRIGAILVTPAYMAPEQESGQRGDVTTATDVHDLGALPYALLTVHAFFRGESVADTLLQARESAPQWIRKANRQVPRDLETEFVRFAHEQNLSVDLTTPPRRPDLAALVAEETPTR